MNEPLSSTIAAIATPPGPGGIGVIRISGPEAPAILNRLFSPQHPVPKLQSHRLYLGRIRRPDSGQVLDEVLAVHMAAPHTYTREEVVEIHCHGNFLLLQEVLVLAQEAGARLAGPGEFTKRAFLNGRIDLSQAEAVLDLLTARSPEGLGLAVRQLEGGLSARIAQISEALLRLRAVLEVAIDFPEEEPEILDPPRLLATLTTEIIPALKGLISAADHGKIARDGIAAAIIGRPNVGKSSLLNALLREERAIVTPLAGTTRDTIEEAIAIHGLALRLIDTAGIRDAHDPVEDLGVQRAKQTLSRAEVALLLVDASAPLTAEDLALLQMAANKPLLVVANKCDLCRPAEIETLRARLAGQRVIPISARKGEGLAELEEAIFTLIAGGLGSGWDPGLTVAPNARHRAALTLTREACQRLKTGLQSLPLAPELLAIETQTALDHLGDIVGHTTPDEMLDRIFGEFCIGK